MPAGYLEALATALYSGGRHVGFMALLSSSRTPPTADVRRAVARLVPIIARGVDPMLSVAAAARMVRGAEAGVVLGTAGGTTPMPGLGDDPLLTAGSGLLGAARASLRGETTCASFLWPRGGRHAPDGHVRVTVLSAPGDVLALWSGMVVLSPAGDLLGLTPRELEVMGLLVTGRTNAEMAESLVVALRTVAAHVEHILHKLGVPSRTLAAVRAGVGGAGRGSDGRLSSRRR